MITEGILNLFFSILSAMFSMLPDISWSVESGLFASFLDFIRLAGYFFPMGTVVTIISLIFAFTMFRIIISFIKTLWGLLPFA